MSPEEEGRGASAYMVMQPGASTPPTGTSGYVEMTTRSQRNTDLSPASSESDRYLNMSVSRPPASSPIPIRGPPDSLYKDMSHCTPLPTVTEGGSNEGYLPMSPTYGQSPFSSAHLKPEPAVCMLSDDTLEFPKRTYSLGSKPPVNTGNKTSGYLDMTINKGVTDKGRSCSAPHLIPQRKLHLDSPTPSASPLSTSMRSDDSESFMEFDFYRPRTASDSYSYRPRASSFGNKSLQAHRPRSSSHGQQARTFKPKKAFDSVRTTSEELRQSMSSCQGSSDSLRMSSSESLRKLSREVRAKTSSLLSTDYLDMSIDKRKTPSPQPGYQQTPTSKPNGYMDMTLGMRTSSPSRCRTPQERSGSFSSGTFNKTRDKMIQERSGSFSSGTSHKILPVSEIPTKKSYSSDKVHNMSTSVDNKPTSGDMYVNMDMSSSSSQIINDPNQKSGKDNSRSSSAENLESYVMYEPKVTTRTSSNTPHNKQIRPISSDSSIKRSSDRPSKRDQRKKTGNASKSNQWLHNAEQQSSIEKNDEYIEFSPMSKSPDGKALSKTYAKSNVGKDCDSLEDSCEYMGFEPGQVAGNTSTPNNQKKSSTPGQIVSQRSYFGNVNHAGAKEPKKLASSASFSGRSAHTQRFKNKNVSDESEYLNFEPATNVKSQTSRKDETSAGKNRRQKADLKSSPFNPNKVPSAPIKDNKVKPTVEEGSNEDSKIKRVANYVEDDYLLTEKLDTTSIPSAGIKQLPIPINPPCILSVDKSPSNSSPGQIKTIKTPDKNKTASNNSLSSVSNIGGSVLDPAHARHSISDLSGYEQMTFPTTGMSSAKLGSSSSVSSTGKNIDKPATGMKSATPTSSNVVSSMSNLSVNVTSPCSGSQQQLTSGKEVLNYASLDLGSSENIGDDSLRSPRIKSRHASAADEKVEPLSYAQIDFEKCESLKALTNSKSDISKTGIGESKL
ncbi:uncharacterized protein LOC126824029 [Patella vulgata]|uniref:uncharacterized protein LOC126824029 n=1 Tax=Patella vulgata TaxID=6465 RepID=UPI0024A7B618|nr:uncharacterized protein LOC126824029 [Patella vulgata]